MTEDILDEKAKSYLIACLVTGIDIVEDSATLMDGLVGHLNSTERIFWAEGDKDGIIVHDKNDFPFLYLAYNGTRLKFNLFEKDEFTELNTNKNLGYALLNIIGYFQEGGYEFGPSILGSEAHVVRGITNTSNEDDTNQEDWSL